MRDDAGKGQIELLEPVEVSCVLGDRPRTVRDTHQLQSNIVRRHRRVEFASILQVCLQPASLLLLFFQPLTI